VLFRQSSSKTRKASFKKRELEELIQGIESSKTYSHYNRVLNKTIVIFLANTGLRAKKFCNLELEDIDLDAGMAKVWFGKSNKHRKLGLNQVTKEQLIEYLKLRPSSDSHHFFINQARDPYTTKSLIQKMKRISDRFGFDITCHGRTICLLT
jgi:integrase